MRFMVVSRKWFEILRDTDPATLTDIQRAARQLYLLKNSYAGLVRNPNFRYGVAQTPEFNPERLPEIIEETHQRLARVQIECLPYEKVLSQVRRRNDAVLSRPAVLRPQALRYNLDPDDFRKMAERLGDVARQVRAFAERRSRGARDLQAVSHHAVSTSPTPRRKSQADATAKCFITNFLP